MIQAGVKPQIQWGDGNWIFLDIGFSHNKPSSGLLFGDGVPQSRCFGCARRQIVQRIREAKTTVNLVIEAPLSICFDSKGNPKGRRIEKQGSKTRYWYNGPGCAVMVAALYLIRDIKDAKQSTLVRLFEGFVSYKDRSTRSNDKEDVCLLRSVVRDPRSFAESTFSPEELEADKGDVLCSAFRVAGLDCGVPAVIRAYARP